MRRVKLDQFKIDTGFGCFDWMGKYVTEGSELGIINAMVHKNQSFRSDLADRVSHLQFFLISLLFQAGIYARHTKEQETYRFHMF